MTQRKPKLVVTVMKQVANSAKIRPEAMAKAKNKGGKERGENAENAGDLSDPVHFW